MKKIYLIFMAVVLPMASIAQDMKLISGTVKDKKTQSPIPYAHVYVQGTSLLTVSNLEGEFVLKVPKADQGKEIEVSEIGYKSFVKAISSISKNINVELERDVTVLKAVDISVTSPETLITSAVKSIPDNYFQETALLRGFYREIGKVNDEYGHVAEAVVNIQKGPYKGKLSGGWDDVALVKGRELGIKDSLAMSIWKAHPFAVQGGIYNTANHDIAKHAYSLQYTFIRKDHFNQYNYTLEGQGKVDDRPVYIIKFDQKERINQALYQGEILIDVETKAFVQIKYKLSESHLDNVPITRHSGVELHQTERYGEVQYRMLDDKWYLSYSMEGEGYRADAHSPKMKAVYQEVFGQEYMTTGRSFELAVTYMDYGDHIEPLDQDKLLDYRDVLMHLDEDPDDNYWENYNYIKLGKTLKSTFDR